MSKLKSKLLGERQPRVLGGRVHRYNVRVTPEEHLRLDAAATERGVSIPRLLVESALWPATSVQREDLTELFAVGRKIGAIGTNVNQIARAANSTGEVSEELEVTLAYVRTACVRIDEIARAVTGRA